MFLIFCTFVSALYLAGIAAWFSIEGIMAIFSGLPISALCMGVGIEVAKIVSVSWLYRNWDTSTRKLKYSALFCTFVALLLTSMGIFGYLSKAHLEQNAPVDGIQSELVMIQYKVDREQAKIKDNTVVLSQLDDTVNALIKNDKISSKNGAKAVRESQKAEREQLNNDIEESLKLVDGLQEKKIELQSSIKSLELEVGPIKYLAAAIYGEEEGDLEKAVRIVIVLIMLAFDPFAIILLMCANHSVIQREKARKPKYGEAEKPKDNVKNAEPLPDFAAEGKNNTFEHLSTPKIDTTVHFDIPEFNFKDETTPIVEEVPEPTTNEYVATVKEEVNTSARSEYVPAQPNEKEERMKSIREKLRMGEIGWITPPNKK